MGGSRQKERTVRRISQKPDNTKWNPVVGLSIVVATFLTDQQQARVRCLFSDQQELLAAHSWAELKRIVRTKPVTVVIVNPAADGNVNIDATADLLREYPSLPVIAYVGIDPASIRGMIALSHRGLACIVLQGFEDSPERFKATIDQVRVNPLVARILLGLRPKLASLPMSSAHAVEEVFASPHRFRTSHDIALAAGVSLVRLYREFQMLKPLSPRRVIVAAKLSHGVGYLQDPGLTVGETATRLGYGHPRILEQHSLEVLGVTPSRVKSHLSLELAHKRLRAWLEIPRKNSR